MRCFYCAEDIREEAVVCRHCKRDLHYLRELTARISALEETVKNLTPATVQPSMPVPVPPPPKPQTAAKWVPGLACAAISFPLWIDVGADDDIRGFIGLALLLFFGLTQGLWWQGRHTAGYVIWGGISGLAIFAANAIEHERTGGILAVIMVLSILLYTTGGLIGDFVERLVHPSEVRPGLADAVAQKISSTGTSDEGIKKLAAAISAIAPILTMAGGIIVAIISKKL